jgi:hypothetical protein
VQDADDGDGVVSADRHPPTKVCRESLEVGRVAGPAGRQSLFDRAAERFLFRQVLRHQLILAVQFFAVVYRHRGGLCVDLRTYHAAAASQQRPRAAGRQRPLPGLAAMFFFGPLRTLGHVGDPCSVVSLYRRLEPAGVARAGKSAK